MGSRASWRSSLEERRNTPTETEMRQRRVRREEAKRDQSALVWRGSSSGGKTIVVQNVKRLRLTANFLHHLSKAETR